MKNDELDFLIMKDQKFVERENKMESYYKERK
jgi:hypothetical protein